MKPQAHSGPIPLERRKQLLLGIPAFHALPPVLLDELAAGLREEHYAAGVIIVLEGEVGDRLFLIEDGKAQVTTSGATTGVILAELNRGDMFGEIALLVSNRRRQATVAATTPMTVLSLSSAAFEKAMTACPDARLDLAVTADSLLTTKFIKQQIIRRQ